MDQFEWETMFQFSADEHHDISIPTSEKSLSLTTAMSPQMPTPPVSPVGGGIESPFQLQTPSDDSTPDEQTNTIVSVSTTFFPGANVHTLPPDLILLSSDAVFFYVHCQRLLDASDNKFGGLLPAVRKDKSDGDPIISIGEDANVINVVLHTIHGIPCNHYAPSVDTLVAAVEALRRFGFSIPQYIFPGSPLYTLILSQAPLSPLEFYSLAAAHDLYDLAVPISSHLLSYSLPLLPDELATKMGPIYLKRLFFLHLGRIDALKRLLLSPPHPHAPTVQCDFNEQKKLTRAWALASSYLAWDARPDISTSAMESALGSLGDHLTCEVCQQSLQERIKMLVVQWAAVKRTI